MRTVPAVKVVTAEDAVEEPLSPRVQEALGQLVGAAKEGLLALSVGVGLGVLAELMEEEVEGVVGPKGKWNSERDAVRHGHEDGEVTLGGRRVAVKRPRVRSADGEAEVSLLHLSALRRSRPAQPPGARADARRRLHAPLSSHARAGRLRGRGQRPVDVEVISQPRLRRKNTEQLIGLDEPTP